MKAHFEKRIRDKLDYLYPQNPGVAPLVFQLIEAYSIAPRTIPPNWNKPMLIAYGDHLYAPGKAPLQTLQHFSQTYLRDFIGGIHLLPFYPYTSDDGFSVVDYLAVNPDLGAWEHIEGFHKDFALMFDLVLNHISVSSDWFQSFLRDEAPYNDYFVTADPATDLSAVIRPRTHPLLTPFTTSAGTRYVWTTFSADQVDLNYANPAVLLEMLRVLLDYVQHGADYIRLDAVAFLWKIPGTSCLHLPQTHVVIQLLRDVLDATAPWVKLISETNVPHAENLLYFGDGHNEAQLVYQFALPPLLLHTFYTGDALVLTRWADTLRTPSATTSFFNFTASHDGIGVRPVMDLLLPSAIDNLLKNVQERGGHISYRTTSDGTASPYEMNICYFDALAEPGEPLAISVERFITSQAIMLALPGLPAIYLPSLFGATNWHEGVEQTGRARTINRQKFELATLEAMWQMPGSRYEQVFIRYSALLRQRAQCTAFAIEVPTQILDLHPSIFALRRSTVLALHNVSQQAISLTLPDDLLRYDLLSATRCQGATILQPYQTQWLQIQD